MGVDLNGINILFLEDEAGVYYYLGIVIKVLHTEKRYQYPKNPSVYFGGEGSRLLNLIAESGQLDRDSEVNEFLSYILSKGSGFDNTEEITKLSCNPQDEIAYGLVLNESKGKTLKLKGYDPPIAGEDCELNGELITWKSRLESKIPVHQFQIPQLVQLQKFFYEFNIALQVLQIKQIKPLE